MSTYRRQVFLCISFNESGVIKESGFVELDHNGLWTREKLQEVFAQAVEDNLVDGADVEVVMMQDTPTA